MSRMIAERREGGRGGVSLCDACEDIHVRWDRWTLSLDRACFFELARMLGEAARLLGAEPRRANEDVGAGRGSTWTH